jgi:hypothetical protein
MRTAYVPRAMLTSEWVENTAKLADKTVVAADNNNNNRKRKVETPLEVIVEEID